MKSILKKSILVCMVIGLTTGFSFARKGGPGHGPRGENPVDILSGTAFTFNGTVLSFEKGPQGTEIETVDGNVVVNGLGPLAYWDSLGIEPPAEGDEIEVSGFTVTSMRCERNIAMSVIFDGEEVQLRDPETGEPLWDKANHLLSGTPFSYSGIITEVPDIREIVVSTDEGDVVLSGIGPVGFWEDLGMTLPAVDDEVIATGLTVEHDDVLRNVIMTITVNGQYVQLRDLETGMPLWRGMNRPDRPEISEPEVSEPDYAKNGSGDGSGNKRGNRNGGGDGSCSFLDGVSKPAPELAKNGSGNGSGNKRGNRNGGGSGTCSCCS